jgi:exonuclease III
LTMDKSFHAKLSEKRILNLKCSNVYVANFYDPAYRFLTTLL